MRYQPEQQSNRATEQQSNRATELQSNIISTINLWCSKVMRAMPVIVLICVLSFSPDLAYSEQDCYEEQQNLQCDPWISVTVTRSFPVFTACQITVFYSYRECLDISCSPPRKVLQYRLGSIDIPDYCQGLMAQLFPGFPDNWGGIMNQAYWNMLVDAIFYTLGKEYIVDNSISIPNCSGIPPNCDDAPTGCDNIFEVYYTQPKCRAYCVLKGPVGPLGFRNTSVTPIHCDSETTVACCEHRKYFCYCGSELQVTNVDTYTQGNCNVLVEPVNLCPYPEEYERHFINCSQNCGE
ncbi:MAG: hypothetical protein KIT33_11500 [Candidatus Kapabacteria bacterium]|nr:hypothetical protein [Ignavibacteriota bacterium]MCW5885584.1 hypothetical protein [Candidatus Kapabacteria bacterium]